MSKDNKMENKSTEELQKEKQQYKFGTYILIGVLIFYFVLTVPKAIEANSLTPILIPLIMSSLIPISYLKIGQINNEIKKRGN